MCQVPACTNELCKLFPPPRAGMWVVRASSVVGWPWTRSGNSLCGPLLFMQRLHWSSGPLPWPSPGLRCRVACAMTSPHWPRPPPAALARPLPVPINVPMALPSHPRTFSVLGYCHWSFSALLVQVLWDWASFGWHPYPAHHAVTHGPRSPSSWMCAPSRLSDTMRYHAHMTENENLKCSSVVWAPEGENTHQTAVTTKICKHLWKWWQSCYIYKRYTFWLLEIISLCQCWATSRGNFP